MKKILVSIQKILVVVFPPHISHRVWNVGWQKKRNMIYPIIPPDLFFKKLAQFLSARKINSSPNNLPSYKTIQFKREVN